VSIITKVYLIAILKLLLTSLVYIENGGGGFYMYEINGINQRGPKLTSLKSLIVIFMVKNGPSKSVY
jgi:hypothetical protein